MGEREPELSLDQSCQKHIEENDPTHTSECSGGVDSEATSARLRRVVEENLAR